MCEICHMTPCHPQCPNAPEPPAVYYCKVCGEPIVAGETYYEMDSEFYQCRFRIFRKALLHPHSRTK